MAIFICFIKIRQHLSCSHSTKLCVGILFFICFLFSLCLFTRINAFRGGEDILTMCVCVRGDYTNCIIIFTFNFISLSFASALLRLIMCWVVFFFGLAKCLVKDDVAESSRLPFSRYFAANENA